MAVSGETVVVGAIREDSSAPGVNGNQVGNNASNSGAVYLFTVAGPVTSPTDLTLDTASLIENLPVPTLVGTLSATNLDDPETSSYALVAGLGDADNGSFSISGDQLLVADPLDFEVKETANIRLRVEDRSGLSFEKALTLSVLDDRSEDADGDGLSEAEEEDIYGTSDTNPDSDEDGFADGVEVANSTDPTDDTSFPALLQIAQQAYLKASNTGANDYFGYSVAVDGDTVVVGAWQENSGAIGVNGNQANDGAYRSGAAYIFVRSGTIWSQQAYLKASNTETSDFFSTSVAVSRDTVVVGAVGEDSSATGVNGNQADNSAGNSGAVYLFAGAGPIISPNAAAVFNVLNIAAGQVKLDGSASSDTDGAIISYVWNWSGGTASGASPTVNLPTGDTQVTLTVTDNQGATDDFVFTASIVSLADAMTAAGLIGPDPKELETGEVKGDCVVAAVADAGLEGWYLRNSLTEFLIVAGQRCFPWASRSCCWANSTSRFCAPARWRVVARSSRP